MEANVSLRLEGPDRRFLEIVPSPHTRGEYVLAEFVYTPLYREWVRTRIWDYPTLAEALDRHER